MSHYEHISDDDLRRRLDNLLADDTVWKVFEALRIDAELRDRKNEEIHQAALSDTMETEFGNK